MMFAEERLAIIIGIDPGSRVTGFGVLRILGNQIQHVSHGVILLDEKKKFSERLLILSDCLQKIMTQYQPDIAVVEKIFLGKNADSAFKLGHARGISLMESHRANTQIFEYATRVVKKGITGKGSADKEEVRLTLLRLLGIKKIEKLDASDALALALYHAQRMIGESRYQRMKEVDL